MLEKMKRAEEVVWRNPHLKQDSDIFGGTEFSQGEIDDAEKRLERFAPLIMHYFPETIPSRGIIETPLTEIENMRKYLEMERNVTIPGRMFLKRDSDLPVSGSVKARGGIYEVLKHTEDLAIEKGIITGPDDDIMKLASPEAGEYYSGKKVQVGSTGNLGLSIGIMSAALGYQAIVHMSSDAKQWKKDLLRQKGAEVREYSGDYGEAVRTGRALSDMDPDSYFVDDEHSRELFLGYAVAGRRLQAQLRNASIPVDSEHPLVVYIPCGVGGAPGGITYGLKRIYGNDVHVVFVEPTQAPCMLLGLATEKYGDISVTDIGLTGKTRADGLAVGRCSDMVAREMMPLLSGEVTVSDDKLNIYLRALWETEKIFIEPSACAAFEGAVHSTEFDFGKVSDSPNTTHVIWATGGSMVPAGIRSELLET